MQYLFIIYKHCLYSVFVVYSVLNNYLKSFYYLAISHIRFKFSFQKFPFFSVSQQNHQASGSHALDSGGCSDVSRLGNLQLFSQLRLQRHDAEVVQVFAQLQVFVLPHSFDEFLLLGDYPLVHGYGAYSFLVDEVT